MGAIAFSASTNSVPRTLMKAACGTVSPRMAPMTMPMAILMISLVFFQTEMIFFYNDLIYSVFNIIS